MSEDYQTNREWERIAQNIVKPGRTVIVIGGIDVGKSMFCRFLIERGIANGLKVGFVDADVGQSQIGPPTTIGLKVFADDPESSVGQKFPLGCDDQPDGLYFVGWTSPERHLLPCVAGTRLMVDEAIRLGADFVVIDTTGYVDGATAVILKQHKIELTQPTDLVCIHRSRELDTIVQCCEGLNTIQTHRLFPHKAVTAKSSEFRRKYRQACFERYFSDCVSQTLPFDQIRGQRTPFFGGRPANGPEVEILSDLVGDRVLYAEWGNRSLLLVTLDMLSNLVQDRLKKHLSLRSLVAETPTHFERCLVGLLNASGNTVSIGIIEALDFGNRHLKIRCKAGTASEARILQLGRYRVG